MKEEKMTFASEVDGLELSAMALVPEGEIKGIVQIVHGMCEYKERYLDFMRCLADNGYVVIIHDHRGHGDSVKSQDDLGYMYEGGAEGLVEDVHQLTMMTKKRFPDVPYYLLGHSMGSLIVRCVVKKYDGDIDKLIVMGSPSKSAAAGFGYGLATFAEKIRGSRARWKILDYMVIEMSYERPYKNEGRNAWVCSNKEVLEKYNNDPKCDYRFTISGYKNLIRLLIETYDEKGWQVNNSSLPILFLSGEGDPCAVNRKAWEDSQSFMKKIGYKNVNGIMYPDMRHEVLNEAEHKKVYSDVIKFLHGEVL